MQQSGIQAMTENPDSPEKFQLPHPKSNAEFLISLFGEGNWVWSVNFQADPNHAKPKHWAKGKFIRLPGIAARDEPHSNTYFCVSTFREDREGHRARRHEQFEALYVVAIDDVGTKGRALSEVASVLQPTYIIETSPDNYHVGYALIQPCTEKDKASALMSSLNDEHGDRSAKGVNRVMRLPYGVNTKQGQNFQVRIESWTGNRFTIDEIAEAFDVKLNVAFLNRQQGNVKRGRGNENVRDDDLETQVSPEQIERMLQAIDPNKLSYDEWLRIGQAIHTQYPDQVGLTLWDSWSSKGRRYQPRECTSRWHGLRPDGRVRVGTLFYFARQGDWEPESGEVVGEIECVLAEINSKYPLCKIGNKVRCVEADAGGGIHPYTLSDVKLLYENKPVEIRDANGTSRRENPINLWRRWTHRQEYDGVGLYPPPLSCPDGHLNLWKGFAVEPREGDVRPFMDFVQEVICDGNEDHARWLLDWCAQLIHEPGKKTGTCIVLRGKEGTGKDSFSTTIGRLFRDANYTHMIDSDHFISNFNAHLLQSVLLVANEAVWSGNHKEANKLKGMITQNKITIELKGVDKFDAVNSTRLIIQTNEQWAVPAGANSRRYFALKVSECRKGDSDYWQKLYVWIDSHLPELLHFLSYRLITSNLHEAPVTDELRDQRAITAERETTLVDE